MKIRRNHIGLGGWGFVLALLLSGCATAAVPSPTRFPINPLQTRIPSPTLVATNLTPISTRTISTPTREFADTPHPLPAVVTPLAQPTTRLTLTPARTNVSPTATDGAQTRLHTPTATNEPTATPSATDVSPTRLVTRAATSGVREFTFHINAEPVIGGFHRPVYVTSAGDGTNRLFVVEQQGRIWVIENGRRHDTPFLDIQDKITTRGNEQGLLGLAFHPDYKNSGRFFVNYSREPDGDNVIEEYRVSNDPNLADAAGAKTVLTIPGLEPNHNGGMLAFGPDGYLYIGTGDGGGAGDRHGAIGNGQDLNTLLGKILRIDVNADPYGVPADNPFVHVPNARPEIWAYGLRNPWRFSFDRATGDLYIADVGQNAYEEVDFQPAFSRGGENYGWRLMEGNHCYDPREGCNSGGLVPPIAEYSHDFGCSITGGYVYRGQAYPWLQGVYLFADYCSGLVWATQQGPGGTWQTRRVGRFAFAVSSFGEDERGEIYVVGHDDGTVYQVTSTP